MNAELHQEKVEGGADYEWERFETAIDTYWNLIGYPIRVITYLRDNFLVVKDCEKKIKYTVLSRHDNLIGALRAGENYVIGFG